MMGYAYVVLVGIAVLVGCELAFRRGQQLGLETRVLVNGSLWAVLVGFPVSHWVVLIVYHPQLVLDDPLTLLSLSGGLSSFGGFLGGTLGAYIYFRRKRVECLPYMEAILFGFVPAWILGRLGCTLTFDHPGWPTDFILGMTDRAGVVRHNLGLYEMLWTVVMTAVLYGLRDVRPFRGFHSVLVIALYAPVRFGLDFLRVGEPIYWGLTPAQYGCLLLLLLGIVLTIRGRSRAPSSAIRNVGSVLVDPPNPDFS